MHLQQFVISIGKKLSVTLNSIQTHSSLPVIHLNFIKPERFLQKLSKCASLKLISHGMFRVDETVDLWGLPFDTFKIKAAFYLLKCLNSVVAYLPKRLIKFVEFHRFQDDIIKYFQALRQVHLITWNFYEMFPI